MTKSELIKRVADLNPGIPLGMAENALTTILDEISDHLSKGGRVELRGFGVFEIRKRKARGGLNPRTGEPVKIPDKTIPFFKAGRLLKQEINS